MRRKLNICGHLACQQCKFGGKKTVCSGPPVAQSLVYFIVISKVFRWLCFHITLGIL